MQVRLPRILIVSEATLSARGTGINRTLVNLFEGYPADSLQLLAPIEQILETPPAPRWTAYGFRSKYLREMPNRFGWICNRWCRFLSYSLRLLLPLSDARKIAEFRPEIILLCANTLGCLIVAEKLQSLLGAPVVVYAMDDWRALDNERCGLMNGYSLIRRTLRNAAALVTVSKELAEGLAQHYGASFEKTLVAHNPVRVEHSPAHASVEANPILRIAYAGSLWSMHFDAFAVVAAAVAQLRAEGEKAELILYTDERFWLQNAELLEGWGVVNGGFVPYERLGVALEQAHLLLVTSSFLPQNEHLSRASVQTKLTDYMAAGRPLLACGPAISACNSFVKRWDCGFCIETNDVAATCRQLRQLNSERSLLNAVGARAQQTAAEQFSVERVSRELYEFLSRCVPEPVRLHAA